MPCGWEGNRRSCVALAMRHRLQCMFIQLRAHGLDREMSTPPTLSCRVRPIYVYLNIHLLRTTQRPLIIIMTHTLHDNVSSAFALCVRYFGHVTRTLSTDPTTSRRKRPPS